jgi:hypothetical protein
MTDHLFALGFASGEPLVQKRGRKSRIRAVGANPENRRQSRRMLAHFPRPQSRFAPGFVTAPLAAESNVCPYFASTPFV